MDLIDNLINWLELAHDACPHFERMIRGGRKIDVGSVRWDDAGLGAGSAAGMHKSVDTHQPIRHGCETS
jgi:hypothetical protein